MIDLQDNVLNGVIDFFIGNYSVQNDQLIMDVIGAELTFLAVPNNSSNKGLEKYQVPLSEIIENKYTVRPSVDFSAFSNDPFTLQPSQHVHTIIIDICKNAGFEPTIVLQTNKPDIAYTLVQRGLGSTIVSETLIRSQYVKNHPFYYRLPEKFSLRNIILVHRKNRYISNIAEEFIDIYKEFSL